MTRTLGTSVLLIATLVAASAACKKKSTEPAAGSGSGTGTAAGTGSGTAAGTGAGTAAGTAAGTGSGTGAGMAAAGLPHFMEGLATPESVLYDAANDRYLVANINGGPADVDDNGFITVLSPDGKVVAAKWIDGAAADVTLSAPKGMAISGGKLWVADVSAVRTFDLATGKPLAEIKIDGADFLNDVAATADGGVVVSDTGVDKTFTPTGNDAIYRIGADGKVTTVIKDKALGGPNGVHVTADGTIWVVTNGTGELYAIDPSGAKQPGEKLPKGSLDGLVALDGGDLLVSSWEGSAVFRGKPGGPWTAVAEGLKAPADIGWDSKRGWLLVPLFNDNMIHTVAIAK
ncbi:MAG: SMP-30/gluconolactonase/LRE family protein [Myxococcales bacterium]|nr:SMP-30/gluconolactonase/LRE family protein [Myxococcales bacterium]